MRLTVALRHQDRQQLAHDLVFRIAKNGTRTVVPGQDTSLVIGGDDRFDGRLCYGEEAALSLMTLGDFARQGRVGLGALSGPLGHYLLNDAGATGGSAV